MGGTSTEHDISMQSGSVMLHHLDPDKYLGFPILITEQNQWLWPKNFGETETKYHLNELQEHKLNPGASWNRAEFPFFSDFPRCDMLMIGLHGAGGEDGKLQGFLDLCSQAYTGSGCLGSAMAMDKIKSKELFNKSGILTPEHKVLTGDFNSEKKIKELETQWGLPMVLKIPQGGSSLGVIIPETSGELKTGLKKLGGETDRIIAEKFIKGREATCGYIENFKPLPPTEIIPLKDGFFNYEAKYDPERTREVTPGNFESTLLEKMHMLAEKCHKTLGLSVYSRTDLLLENDKLYVLETNSLPGFTDASILPQEAELAGLDYKNLLTKIIEESLCK